MVLCTPGSPLGYIVLTVQWSHACLFQRFHCSMCWMPGWPLVTFVAVTSLSAQSLYFHHLRLVRLVSIHSICYFPLGLAFVIWTWLTPVCLYSINTHIGHTYTFLNLCSLPRPTSPSPPLWGGPICVRASPRLHYSWTRPQWANERRGW